MVPGIIPPAASCCAHGRAVIPKEFGYFRRKVTKLMEYLLALIVMGVLAFVPVFIVPKQSPRRGLVMAGCIVLALLIFPSVLNRWDAGQTAMILAWLALGIIAIIARVQYKPEPNPAPNSNAGPDASIAKLERLAKLRAEGALTEEEYNAEKAKVLSK